MTKSNCCLDTQMYNFDYLPAIKQEPSPLPSFSVFMSKTLNTNDSTMTSITKDPPMSATMVSLVNHHDQLNIQIECSGK